MVWYFLISVRQFSHVERVRCIIRILDFNILVFYQNRDWKRVFTQCYDAQVHCAHTILLSIFYLTCLYLPWFLSKTCVCDGNILSATGSAVSLLVNLSTGVCGFWFRKSCLFLFLVKYTLTVEHREHFSAILFIQGIIYMNRNGNICKGTWVSKVIAETKVDAHV